MQGERMSLASYLPQDRYRALARGESPPELMNGSALFADISGFTRLTETLHELLGPRLGAEELTKYLDAVYTTLINEVEQDGGSVIGFAGDAITCWFDDVHGPAAPRAVHCAFALQRAMSSLTEITLSNRFVINLALKVAVATGPIRRFTLGDPSIQYLDALVGTTVMRTSTAERLAQKGDVLVDESTLKALGDSLTIQEWRQDPDSGEQFAVAAALVVQPPPPSLPPVTTPPSDNGLRPWINATIYERERAGQASFLTEFRPCTALFVRFTGIDYDASDAEEKLDTLIRQIQGCAKRHQGTLLQLTIGDKGSYAYINFGALNKHEDDARRSVKTALDLKKEVEELGFQVPLQIGISQGVLRVGAVGGRTRREYSAMGDDVNLAARLMSSAAAGEILISGRLRTAILGDFIVEARPSMAMKGKKELVHVFAVLGMEQHRAIRLQEPTYAMAMIGRSEEMALLKEKLQAVLQGHGQIIGVTAEAGMGKSRLVAEGIRLARRNKFVGYGGACQSDGANTPYLVWRSIWNAFFDLDPLWSLRKQIRSLEGELEDRAPEHVDALPLLGTALGLPIPDNDYTRALQPKDRKTQLEAMLVKLLESAVQEAIEENSGILLVLEDLHWIDQLSFDLLETLAWAIQNLPVLVLLTYRGPDASMQRQALTRLEALDHFTQIKLQELSTQETEQVIRSKLFSLFPERAGKVPPILIERITSRAQGNPFYVEELLNYLHDRNIDLGNDEALKQLDLPTSLHSLILSRIDQLTSSQQLTIKVASIIGRVFRFEDLHNYYPPLDVAGKLKADLQELEHLELTPLESPEPELTYLFKHPVTHEVGYESLSFATRVQLHGQYARYLEDTYPDRVDQLAPQLAHHFERAQIRDKARFYLVKAGEQAAANFANDEALTYFNRALNLTRTENNRIRFDTLLKRERVYDLLGRRTEQRWDLEELTRLANQLAETPSLRAQIAIRRAKLEIDEGNHAAAKSSIQDAIQDIDVNDHADLMVDALLLEIQVMLLAGQREAAKTQLDRALAIARNHHYVRGEYNVLAATALWNWYGGNSAGAAMMWRKALDQIRQAGDLRRELEILNNLGIVNKDMYQFQEALEYYERALQIAKKIGDRSGEATLLTNMGSASLVATDYIQAGLYSAQAAEVCEEVRERPVQGMALSNRSLAFLELGQYARAKQVAEEALLLIRSAGILVAEANILENMAVIEFALGNPEQAMEHLQNGLVITRDAGARRVEASILIRMGMIQLKMGQLDAAEKAFLDSKGIVEEIREPVRRFELQAGLAGTALARGGAESLELARLHIQELVDEILRDPPTGQSHILPMGLYLMAIRVMHAQNDPRTSQLINRAHAELQARNAKINDPSLSSAFMDIPEHREILEFARMLAN
jgi:class 3 adenylate cyclase/predicted ATPase